MKKTVCLLLTIAMALSAAVFAGCGEQDTKSSSTGKSSAAIKSSTSSKASKKSDVEVMELPEMDSKMQAVADSLEIKEHRCTGLEYEFIIFVVTNKSDKDCGLTVVANFYDKDKTLVDSQDEDIEAVGAGETAVVAVYANEKFKTYTSDFAATELTSYTAVTKDLKLNVKENGTKLEASVTNNGKKTACYTTVHTLFFKDGKIYDYDKSYVGDDNSEIAPGKTETKEIFTASGSDRYETYLNSYAKAD